MLSKPFLAKIREISIRYNVIMFDLKKSYQRYHVKLLEYEYKMNSY